MINVKSLFLLFFYFQLLFAIGQEVLFKPKVEYFSFPNSELNTDEITDIKTDKEGYVWIISLNSIYRYNGNSFSKIDNHQADHGSFLRFFEDYNGRKFVTDYLGSIFYIENDKLIPFEKNHELRSKSTFPKSTSFHFDSLGNLHISSSINGYHIYKNGVFTKQVPPFKFRGFGVKFLDSNTPFYFSSGYQFNFEERSRYPLRFSLFAENKSVLDSVSLFRNYSFNPISSVQLPNQNFLFSTGRGSIVEFNENEIVRQIPYPDQINRLFIDKQQNLWISTLENGIHFYPKAKIDYQHKIIFLENTTSFVSAQDYQGGLWYFTKGKGLGYMSNPQIGYTNTDQDFTISATNHKLYFANKDTIWLYNEQTKETSIDFINLDYSPIQSIHFNAFDQSLFVSSAKKLIKLKEGNQKNISPHKLRDFGTGIRLYFDRINKTNPSLVSGYTRFQYFNYDLTEDSTFASSKFESFILGGLRIKDSIWVKTTEGLHLISKKGHEKMGDLYPIANHHVRYSEIYNGKAFFSISGKGLFYFFNNEFREIKYNGISLTNSILAVENDTVLWAFTKDACYSIKSQKANKFSVNYHPPLPKIAIDEIDYNKNYIYATSHKGQIAQISFEEIRNSNIQKPSVLVYRVKTPDSILFNPINIIELPYHKRSIEFTFESIDYKNQSISYRYKLDGLDNDWLYSTFTTANYASIPAGTYTFLLQSRFGIGAWKEASPIKIKIIRPYWQEAWFLTTIGLLILSILAFGISYRFNLYYKQQSLNLERMRSEQKALRALMTPHYIFNFIASLQYLIEEEGKKRATRFIELFASSMRNILKQADHEFISVKNEISFLEEYIHMEQFRLEDRFQYQINVSEKIDLEELIPTFVIQPFVENAIQHGLLTKEEGGFLSISIEEEKNFLKFSIVDNGIGRNKASFKKKKKGSYSINLIRNRLRIYNSNEANIFMYDKEKSNNIVVGTEVIVLIKKHDKKTRKKKSIVNNEINHT